MKFFFSNKCNKQECNICQFTEKNFGIKYKNYSLPILCNYNCDTPEIVYIINCKMYTEFYKGVNVQKIELINFSKCFFF